MAAAGVSLLAGLVRGFAGFGFSAVVVAALAPFVNPGPLVAAVLLLEAAASLPQLRSVRRDADRRWLAALFAANAACIPIGVAALAWMPVGPLRVVVGSTLFAGAVTLRVLSGHAPRRSPALVAAAGIGSGLLNGLAASGGVWAAMWMASAGLEPRRLRATMIAYLPGVALYALAWAATLSWAGRGSGRALLGDEAWTWAALLAPGMLLGLWMGGRRFDRSDPTRLRRRMLDLLIAVTALGLTSTLLTIRPL